MTPFGKIYSYPNNFRVQRVRALAALNGLEVVEDSDFKMGETNRSPEFLSKFPMGKVPTFEGADGFCLAESAAIARYVAASGPLRDQLLGADIKTAAKIDEWAFFAESELVPRTVEVLLGCVLKLRPIDQESYNQTVGQFERALKRLEVAVKDGRKFLVSDKITYADVMVGGALVMAGRLLFDAEMCRGVPAVTAWLKGIQGVPEMNTAFGEVVSVETRVKPSA
ncbi:Glutathione S-transferase [Pleurostoma richardsiae]|uniref:Glutathione S-transferase n=1 Tax=Pleurostoma richardsiae TaxID=41990 RepID=A0AA38VHZ6_9PEZI|nr:Glutathione S-transferase [Pleurostoma richardsiae]